MDLLKYIFFLGIVYIVFSIIWFFIALLPKYIFGNKNESIQNTILDYLIKGAQYYFLASLTSIKALKFLEEEKIEESQGPLYVIIGGIVLCLYLAGKMERNRVLFQFKSNLTSIKSGGPLKFEPHLLGLTIIFYTFTFNYPQLIENELNYWFLANINDFYNTVIIGWIVGIIGFFFLLGMIFRGINLAGYLIQTAINLLSGKPPPERKQKNPFGNFGPFGKNNPFGNQNPFGQNNPFGNSNFSNSEPEDADIDEDMYVDFEIIDEEEEKNQDE